MSTSLRLFLALDLPAPLRVELGRLQGALDDTDCRCVPRADLHLTLSFLGDVSRSRCDELRRRLPQLAMNRAPWLEFVNTRVLGRALVFLVAPSAALGELHEHVRILVNDIGMAPDRGAFLPHVTLGRYRRHREMTSVPGFGPPSPALATSVSLVHSTLSHEGARYDTLERIELVTDA